MRKLSLMVAAVILTASSTVSAQSLAWDPNTDADTIGYVVSYGTKSGTYTNSVDVGNATTYSLATFDVSLDFFFVVQAYNSAGIRSDNSPEVKLAAAVPPGTTVINSLTSSSAYPLLAGNPVTWTASAVSKLGPVEYAFFLYSAGTGWQAVQNYSPVQTFTWTPSWDDAGQHGLQVWARTVGSPARYEAWVATESFSVNRKPLQLSASTDFPIPPGQPVTWTASFAGNAPGTALEYEFFLFNKATNAWTAFQGYSASNTATWTPTATGTYAVQAWARKVGSTANYDVYAGSGSFTVSRTALTVTSLSANATFPKSTGAPITWTARTRGGTAGPIQYAFYRYRDGSGWTKAQDYSTSNTYTWTPTWGDQGFYTIQVWARSAGSTASYEAYLSSGVFEIKAAAVQLSTTTAFPIPPGTPVTWNASVSDPTATVEYQFWLYSRSTGTWSLGSPYSSASTWIWTPASAGTYGVQVWVRKVGSTASYDSYRGTDPLTVSVGPVQAISLTPSPSLPAPAGTAITWKAVAAGGSAGPLQYKFFLYNSATGWTVLQDYSSSSSATWTPTIPGTYSLQVWVRSAGSTASYEAWIGSGTVTIQ